MSSGPAGQVTRSTRRPSGETVCRTASRRLLRTADGVSIDAAHDPGTGASGDLAIVVAHGFTGDLERPHVRRAAAVLARFGAVVTFSFRGHGASGGRSTVGDREVLDLAAAVAWARELGHTRVVTVGFSMGGSVVLRHGASYRAPAEGDRMRDGAREHKGRTGARTEACSGAEASGPGSGAGTAPGSGSAGPSAAERAYADAVVSVSAPARWYYRGTAPMRRLHWLVMHPLGRVVGRYALRTRIHHRDWDPVPRSPVESVPLIAPVPLLIVHGDRDGYFPVDHPRMLAEASGGHAELWLEHGMGHAENAAADGLLTRIGAWAVAAAG